MVEKKEVFALLIFTFLFLSIGYASALTGSLGNSRVVLYPEVNGWFNTEIERNVLVKNVNNIPINVTVQAGDEQTGMIEIIDESFILNPGEEKKAEFIVKVKKEGTYEGKVNVFFAPADPESKEPRVALSASVVVIAKKDQGYSESEEENEIESGGNSTITGNSITNLIRSEDGFNPAIILMISTIILLVVLFVLIWYMNKKKRTKKGVKEVKVNGNKKK